MNYTQLGRAGVKVSRLALGTMNFGWHAEESDSRTMMDAALDAGINLFDTADIYGAGASKEILGRWFADDASRRDRVVLATKLYIPLEDRPNAGGLSALHIREACEASLRRLQTDHIDLYQFHHIDRTVQWDEIWEATERLVRDGKIIYVGSSNFAGWDLAAAQETAKARRSFGLASEQSIYNLMERTIELEVLPAARHYGIGLLPWSPLAGGQLAGKGSAAGRRNDNSAMLGHSARERHIADRLARIGDYTSLARELDLTPTVLALAWLLSRPASRHPSSGPAPSTSSPDPFRPSTSRSARRPSRDSTSCSQDPARLLTPPPGDHAPGRYRLTPKQEKDT